jgi:CRP/FNR family transcriptional regulator
MSAAKTERLARVPLLAGLDSPEIEALSNYAVEKHFSPGSVLFDEGEPCDGVFFILSGRVKIYKTSSSGREITLAVEKAPSNVAEVPLFDGGPYPASVSALEPVDTALVHTEDFRRLCRQHPAISLKMLAAAGRRLRQLVSVIELVTFGSVRQRLAGALLSRLREAGSNTFALTGTHQDLASQLGTVREVVSRNMSRFQNEGLIEIAGRSISVLDPDGLRQEAETEL